MNSCAEAPNLRHLRMLQVIGRVGGVSGAARELCTSQPAVTQALGKLEAEFGTPIFERKASGAYPTVPGRQYLLRIDRFFEILDGAIGHVLGHEGDSAGRRLPRVDRLVTGTQLRSLLVIGEQGRVGEIARGLGFSASSVFRSARTLERSLGRPLFDRTARGPVPNKAGDLLAREFRRALRELELARGEVLLAAGAESLQLVVGALPMAGSCELAAATRRFMAAHPAVKVRLVTGEYDKLLVDLVDSRIDMMFGLLRKPGGAREVSEEVLFHDAYCVVARSGHPLARLARVTPAELARYAWVVPPLGTPRRTRIDAIFGGVARRPRFQLETSSLSMSRALLLGSDTITLMARSEVQSDLDLGVLAPLRCPNPGDVLAKGVTTRSDWLPTRAHTAFLDFLREVTAPSRRDVPDPVRKRTSRREAGP